MWANPMTQAHMAALRDRGAIQVGPGVGRLASGASGVGRMAEPGEILAAARWALAQRGPLAGRRVLVTAGGTQEPVDPVRYITNASSGKMGVALAEAARDLGAAVTLVHAPLAVPVPYGIVSLPVRTAIEMCDAVLAQAGETDILIGTAAVADFRPAEAANQKIKKAPGQEEMTLHLVRNPDILAEVAGRRAETGWPKVVVGFAAETQDLLANAGANLIAVPAAFTVPTGQAHWHVLLRARAIETGSWIIAAAQGGQHENGRATYGHSIVIDPWGRVAAELDHDAPGVLMAEIAPELAVEARQRIPALANARNFASPEPLQP